VTRCRCGILDMKFQFQCMKIAREGKTSTDMKSEAHDAHRRFTSVPQCLIDEGEILLSLKDPFLNGDLRRC
jgi:hypothetical protein